MENKLNSSSMERMVVSTYGSFLADSLSNWSQQVEDSQCYWQSYSLQSHISRASTSFSISRVITRIVVTILSLLLESTYMYSTKRVIGKKRRRHQKGITNWDITGRIIFRRVLHTRALSKSLLNQTNQNQESLEGFITEPVISRRLVTQGTIERVISG
jgi:hypothetical protein